MYITTKFDVSIQLEFPLRALKVAICMILWEDYKTSDYIIILVWEKFFLSRLSIWLLCYITSIKQSAIKHKVSILCNYDSITKATDKYTVREIYFAELIEQSGLL